MNNRLQKMWYDYEFLNLKSWQYTESLLVYQS